MIADFTNFNPQPKKGKKLPKPRKPIARRSKKNKPIEKESKAHLMLVKSMPCMLCGKMGMNQAHHVVESYKRLGKREGKEHYYTYPLCPDCHEGNKFSIGNTKKSIILIHGTEREILERFWKMIRFDKRKLED